MSFVALDEKEIVGTILGSHDGRRGFINHLAVKAQYRKHGIARKLVGNTIDSLKSAGMRKIVIFILKNNIAAQSFWERIGFANEDIIEGMK